MELCLEIYKFLKECRNFGFKDQIQRAAVSISSNIAEGFERQTDREFVQYLFVAKGFCGEVRTQLYPAAELQFIKKQQSIDLINKAKKVASMIQNLIKVRKQA